jgi:DNA polymerase-3 subunit beta
MEITLQRAALFKLLQMISGVIERRQTMPILANALLRAKGQELSLTATDLEMELIGTVSLEQAAEPSAITVSAKKLLDICRVLPENALLKFVSEGEHLVLRSGKSRFMLTTLPAQDFPNIGDKLAFVTEFKLSPAKLKSLLGQVYFAMGQQDVRHYLNGALIDVNQGVMKCIATDGHRLAFSSISDIHLGDTKIQVILPRKSVLELMRLLDTNNEASLSICIGENHFRIVAPDFIFTSKLINAQYPDYDKLIPRSIENTVVASREALKQALTRVSILSNEKFRGVRLHLNQDLLRVVANNPEQEEAEELVSLDYQGGSMEIGFNVAYLLDVISAITCERIRWSFADPNAGVLMEALEPNDSFYVVMPMLL